MTLRIVIADQSEARFLDVPSRHALAAAQTELTLAERLVDPAAHLHDRDLKSDRPGRAFEGLAQPGRRGATAHHGVGADRSPRAHEAQLFAQRIMAALQRAHSRGDFDQLVLVAGPHFLGLLRQSLSPALRAALLAELHKDLAHEPTPRLREHLDAALGVTPSTT